MVNLFIYIIAALISLQSSFLDSQLTNTRVHVAKSEKEEIVKKMFESNDINYPPDNIFIRCFKSEAIVEIWALNKNTNRYCKITTYNICALSGSLGPKRRRGDLQIPEGVYYISHFNPVSNFYLSLKLNYPNKSDRILGYKKDLGGDIFIHGNCVTIGCIPITDDKIKELYWIAVLAKSTGQNKIPVHVYPAKLSNKKMNELSDRYRSNPELITFWNNLKLIFDYFEKYEVIPEIKINSHGKYIINNSG